MEQIEWSSVWSRRPAPPGREPRASGLANVEDDIPVLGGSDIVFLEGHGWQRRREMTCERWQGRRIFRVSRSECSARARRKVGIAGICYKGMYTEVLYKQIKWATPDCLFDNLNVLAETPTERRFGRTTQKEERRLDGAGAFSRWFPERTACSRCPLPGRQTWET